MAYTKRFASGFVDKPSLTTPIDAAFLNAVETALLSLYDANPGSANMVPVWTPAGTHYVPQLLTNASIDAAAAIAKSKVDLTGANGIVNADVAGAAAIARSKLDFGSGLVNADIAAAAAIARSKLDFGSGLVNADISTAAAIAATKLSGLGAGGSVTVSAANTDLSWTGSGAPLQQLYISVGGGTLRSVAAPTQGVGTVLCLRAGAAFTVKYLTGGGGPQIYTTNGADVILAANDSITLQYDGSTWFEIARDIPVPYATSLPSSPFHGQQAILVDSTTAPTYQWLFRYNANSSSAYKWEFIGGRPALIQGDPNIIINTGTQVGATGYYYGAGMSFTVPRAGDWVVETSGRCNPNGGAAGAFLMAIFANGGLQSFASQFALPNTTTQVTGTYMWIVSGAVVSTVIGACMNSTVPGTHKMEQFGTLFTPARVS